jgi:hypothetical protein
MANTTTTPARRRRNGMTDEMTGFEMEAARNAQEMLLRSLRAGVDTALTFGDVGQRVGREMITLTMSGTKQWLRMWAEVQGSTIDVFQTGMTPWAEGLPSLRGCQRLVDGSAEVLSRFTEMMYGAATMQGTAD